MKATILTIGDELLIGQTINTNAGWLGERLHGLGVEVQRIVMLADEEAAIREALAQALAEAALVILSGGLGPTHDDLTREAVAAHFGVALHEDAEALARIQQRFAHRKTPMPEANRKVAQVPDGFEVLKNSLGTAPGLWWSDGKQAVVLLPGVPGELQALIREEVEPRLRELGALRIVRQRVLRTAGIGESSLQERFGDLSGWLGPHLRLAYLPAEGIIRLRLTALGDDAAVLEERLDAFEAYLRDRAGACIYTRGEASLEEVVGQMLKARGLTIALAESCTGGLVTSRLTDIAGSSAYVRGGIIAYCNSVKEELLGVDAQVLEREGAVSESVAKQMAAGVRKTLNADIGVAITGIAGPSGGTPDKPVGTVWIGYADAEGASARLLHFTSDRLLNKSLSATAALDIVRRRLLREE